ncbi:hypothetical protein Ndes2526A_g01383 [Nannochloris sp. 'desiccata']
MRCIRPSSRSCYILCRASLPDSSSANKKAAAFATTLTVVGATTFHFLSKQPTLPPVQDLFIATTATLGIGGVGSLVLTKAVLKDKFHAEWHRNRLYFSIGVPCSGPTVSPGAILVKSTGDIRGNGAYATTTIPEGTFLGEYTGEILDSTAFKARYPNQLADFAMAIDDEYVVDAVDSVANIACFHPVHMNHSAGRANVKRYYKRNDRRVLFFTSRDVLQGEELLYDYGRQYWRTRGELELP